MMSGLLPPAVVKDLDNVSHLPAAALCRLIVVIGVICFRRLGGASPSDDAVRTPDALVLDVESCNQLAGCLRIVG